MYIYIHIYTYINICVCRFLLEPGFARKNGQPSQLGSIEPLI